jgi:hypothetical protein
VRERREDCALEAHFTILPAPHTEVSESIFAHFQFEQPGSRMLQPHTGSRGPLIPHSRNGSTGAMFAQPHVGSTGTILTLQFQIEQSGPNMLQPHIGPPGPHIPHSRNGSTGAMFAQPHTGSNGTILTRVQIEQSGPTIPQPHTGSSGPIFAQARYVHARFFLTLPRNENAKSRLNSFAPTKSPGAQARAGEGEKGGVQCATGLSRLPCEVRLGFARAW